MMISYLRILLTKLTFLRILPLKQHDDGENVFWFSLRVFWAELRQLRDLQSSLKATH